MRRTAALLVGLAAVVAVGAPAWAQAIVPDAPVAVGGPGDAARCLRATGAPGQFLLQAPAARRFATDVRDLQGVTGTVRLGAQSACAEAAAGGGRLLVAAPVVARGRQQVRAAFGPGAPVQTLASVDLSTTLAKLRVAVGPNGEAAVAWVEARPAAGGRPGEERATVRIRLARAAADGPLDPATTLLSSPPTSLPTVADAALDFDAAGRLTAVTAEPRPATVSSRGSFGDLSRLAVRTADAGARLAAPQVLDAARQGPAGPQLAVSGDGSALLAASGSGGVEAWSRAAGRTRFRPVLGQRTPTGEVPPGDGALPPAGDAGSEPAVVAGPDQTGALVWSSLLGPVEVLTLGTGAMVGVRSTVLSAPADDDNLIEVLRTFALGDGTEPNAIPERLELRPSLALAPDGRLAIAVPRDARGGRPAVALGAVGSLTGGLGRPAALTSQARSTSRTLALVDTSGSPVVVTADESDDPFSRPGHASGRLTVARAGPQVAPAPPPPGAGFVGRLRATVRGARPAAVRVRCAAACDVRAELPGIDAPLGAVVAGDALPGAGIATLRLGGVTPLLNRPRGSVAVTVRVAAPGGRDVRTLHGTLDLRQLPYRSAPRLTTLRVRRSKRTAVVTFTAPDGLRLYKISGITFDASTGVGTARRLGDRRYRLVIPIGPTTRRVAVVGFSTDLADAPLERRLTLPR